MAVIEWNFLAPDTWGPRCGPDGTRTYQITIEAITDTLDTGASVLSHVGFPLQFVSTHPNDSLAVCNSIDPQQDPDDGNYWVIKYGYTTRPRELAQAATTASGGPTGGGRPSPEHPANPLDRSPKVGFTTRMFKRLIIQDEDDRPIVNQANVPFETFSKEVPRLVMTVERNMQDFSWDLMNYTVGHVNGSSWLGWTTRQVYCAELDANIDRDQGVTFWKVRGKFIVATSDDILQSSIIYGGGPNSFWHEWKLNAGYEYLDGTGGPSAKTVRFTTTAGQPASKPMLLKADGTRLNGTGLFVAGGDPVIWLGFRVLADAEFNALGFFD